MTQRARGYYWRVVVPAIAQYQGEAKYRDTHEWLKIEFLPDGDDPLTGRSTKVSQLTSDEYRDFVRRVVSWARSEGIVVPPPYREEELY